ncbi:hypothetical protein BX600DRAFT_461202 [Xylariales sp. PMI_506]|nr:hypothetical protein BX600DRAFT_461202 [Xylariales sp. PMI_506]
MTPKPGSPISSCNNASRTTYPRDTGFPDWFADITTSLPHPEAKPNAIVGDDELNRDTLVEQAAPLPHFHFFHHNSTCHHGNVTAAEEQDEKTMQSIGAKYLKSRDALGRLEQVQGGGSAERA